MSRRPTPKAGIVAAVGGILAVTGTTAQAGWLFVLAAGVLGLAVSGIVVSQRLAGVEVARTFPARARVGETVPAGLAVRGKDRRRVPMLRVEDRYPAFDPVAVASDAVPPGGEASIELGRVALRRGVFDDGPVLLATAAPFGLTIARRASSSSARLIVHPAWTELRAFPLPETPAATADEALAVARAGHGEVFAGVRDYRPGDQRRWVHWRTTARTGRLVVREHEEPARSPVVLVVASGASPPEDVWETLVAAAASVGVYAVRAGRPLHAVSTGSLPHVDDATEVRLLDWCAALEPGDDGGADAVAAATRRWGRRCSFVVFGPPGPGVDGAVSEARKRGAGVAVVYGAGDPGMPARTDLATRVVRPDEELRACLEA